MLKESFYRGAEEVFKEAGIPETYIKLLMKHPALMGALYSAPVGAGIGAIVAPEGKGWTGAGIGAGVGAGLGAVGGSIQAGMPGYMDRMEQALQGIKDLRAQFAGGGV